MLKQHRPDITLCGGLGVNQTKRQTNLEKKKKPETKHNK
jgi:hypothetical protein